MKAIEPWLDCRPISSMKFAMKGMKHIRVNMDWYWQRLDRTLDVKVPPLRDGLEREAVLDKGYTEGKGDDILDT